MQKVNLGWATDIHLDQSEDKNLKTFFNSLAYSDCQVLLLGGDISHGASFIDFFQKISQVFHKPIYFVLGNHDYYGHSIQEIRALANAFCLENKQFHYLLSEVVVALNENTALLGHDGWADTCYGNFLESTITISDYKLIEDLKDLEGRRLEKKLKELGKGAKEHVKKNLLVALKNFDQVIILTHTPPFPECCLYEGQIADENWGPHFVSYQLGTMIKELAKKYFHKKIITLSGHTHSFCDVMILDNLRAISAHTDIGSPRLQDNILV